MTSSICCGDGCSDPFSVGYCVKEGCVLAPTLFTIFLDAVLKSMPEELGDLYIRDSRKIHCLTSEFNFT